MKPSISHQPIEQDLYRTYSRNRPVIRGHNFLYTRTPSRGVGGFESRSVVACQINSCNASQQHTSTSLGFQQHHNGKGRRSFHHRYHRICIFGEHQGCDRRRACASSSARGSGCAMALSWSYSLCSVSVDEGGITIWIVRKRSPWLPLAAGRPLPFSRSLLSARLPGGTFMRTGSINVGAITSAPKAASHG